MLKENEGQEQNCVGLTVQPKAVHERLVMPAVIFASIVGGYEDHGFGGCAWGCGEKYISRYMPITDDATGSIYYSAEMVKALLNMDKADALREIEQV